LRKSTPKNETKPLDYADRINRAINFVLNNLDRPIRLEHLGFGSVLTFDTIVSSSLLIL